MVLWIESSPDRPGYVDTRDDTTHLIRQGGNVPFQKEDNKTYIKNVLNVPNITKKLVSVDQIVEQGMQVRFNHAGCFIENEGWLITSRQREGQMFILDSHEVTSAMYAKGFKVDIYIELWHKRSAISTFKSSRRCNPKEASSDSLHLKKRKSMEYVKHANSTSNIGTRSRKRRMRAKAYWM